MAGTNITATEDAAAGSCCRKVRSELNKVVDDLESLRAALATTLLQDGNLAISAALPEDFKTTQAAYFRIGGIQFSKAATDGLGFSAADTINTAAAAGQFWGIWLVQINAAGTVSTKSPAANQVYTTEALAIAALPAVDAGNVALGYITIQSKAATAWTANTDDMTPASDCAAANFVDATVDLPIAADLTAAKVLDLGGNS